ncbi:MAG: tRNA (cytidine(34)-2'-O)-methyltransferase, partial [Dongiaceae bacterium]
CFKAGLDIIEPCGFPLSDRQIKRVAMDYIDLVPVKRHNSWEDFLPTLKGRLLLLTVKADANYYDFKFEATDTLLLGQESAGAPPKVHDAADARLRIPLNPAARSLNIAVAAAIVLSEGLRQTGQLSRLG